MSADLPSRRTRRHGKAVPDVAGEQAGRTRPLSVVVAGGGTAGHVEPALALADALRRRNPAVSVAALGTAVGLEARLVPERGYELLEIAKVPLPRRPSPQLATLATRLARTIAQTTQHLLDVRADVVVGFGGYVALPAYLAARRLELPVVVHEANVRPGLANRIGARRAAAVAAAVEGPGLPNVQVIGMPLRPAIATLDRTGEQVQARAQFGVGSGPVLLAVGGSQGARSINTALVEAAPALSAAGVQVLHVTGAAHETSVRAELAQLPGGAPSGYHVLPYVADMHLAYAAADLVMCRSGAMTVAELTAVGLPALYVPLPIGNGEQALNARSAANAGAALICDDQDMTGRYVRERVIPLLGDPVRLTAMGQACTGSADRGADERLAALVEAVAAADAHRI